MVTQDITISLCSWELKNKVVRLGLSVPQTFDVMNSLNPKKQPAEVRSWLAMTRPELVSSALQLLPNVSAEDVKQWTARILEGDAEDILFEIGWSEIQVLGAPGDLTLVEVSECQDPLCGATVLGLVVRKTPDGFFYYQFTEGETQGTLLASGHEILSEDEVLDILDKADWLDSNVTLDSADLPAGAAYAEKVTGGQWPLLSVTSVYPRIPDAFRMWVESYCRKISISE